MASIRLLLDKLRMTPWRSAEVTQSINFHASVVLTFRFILQKNRLKHETSNGQDVGSFTRQDAVRYGSGKK